MLYKFSNFVRITMAVLWAKGYHDLQALWIGSMQFPNKKSKINKVVVSVFCLPCFFWLFRRYLNLP